MKKILSATAVVAVLALVAVPALAHWGGAGFGPGMGWMGAGMGMGPGGYHGGMMGAGAGGPAGCPGFSGAAASGAPEITEEKAKGLAAEYAKSYLPGFTVERVLPFTGMHMTMFQAELKGPAGEVRTLHINPWGNVMPFGGPVAR